MTTISWQKLGECWKVGGGGGGGSNMNTNEGWVREEAPPARRAEAFGDLY